MVQTRSQSMESVEAMFQKWQQQSEEDRTTMAAMMQTLTDSFNQLEARMDRTEARVDRAEEEHDWRRFHGGGNGGGGRGDTPPAARPANTTEQWRRIKIPLFAGASVSETLPCCSSVSTSVGVHKGTVNGSVIAESNPQHPSLVKSNISKSTERNGNLTRTLLKAMANVKRDNKMLNKAPNLHSNHTAASLPRACNQMRRFSSVTSPRSPAFRPSNYRTNATGSSVNDRFLSTDKLKNGESEMSADLNWGPQSHYNNFPPQSSAKDKSCVNNRFLSADKFRSGEYEMSMELTRGPRGHYDNFSPLSSGTSAIKDDFPITICRDKYNLPDLQTEYEAAQFYVIKSFNEDDIHKSIKYDVWTSTASGNKKLNAAFHDAEAKLFQTGMKCPIFLFFSVNASGQFVGVAEMLGPVDYKKDMKFWKLDKYNGFFPIRWHIIKDVPNKKLRHIILESNENRPVTYTRDTQEIGLKQGLEMLNIFKNYPAKTCLLDDFVFYENREKLLRPERGSSSSSKHAIREPPQVYGYFQRSSSSSSSVRAAENRIEEMQPSVNSLSLN